MRYQRLMTRYVSVVSVREALSTGDLLRGPRPLAPVASTHWQPSADVCETVEAVTITIDLAGVDPDELEVLLFEDALVVEGNRRALSCAADGVYHRAEIRQGPFRLHLGLPAAVDAEGIGTRYERGLLHITLPKAAGSRGNKE